MARSAGRERKHEVPKGTCVEEKSKKDIGTHVYWTVIREQHKTTNMDV